MMAAPQTSIFDFFRLVFNFYNFQFGSEEKMIFLARDCAIFFAKKSFVQIKFLHKFWHLLKGATGEPVVWQHSVLVEWNKMFVYPSCPSGSLLPSAFFTILCTFVTCHGCVYCKWN